MPRIHRAEWVLPIDAPPIRDGWVEVADGRIVGVGALDGEPRTRTSNPEPERRTPNPEPRTPNPERRTPNPEPRTVILPALVNAHTHLELSWMRGMVPPGEAMPAWAMRLIGERLTEDRSPSGREKRQKAVDAAIREARDSGTTLVGDVSNTLESCEPLVGSDVSAAVFYEMLGFRAADPVGMVEAAGQRLAALPASERFHSAIAPHAPYSVSPALLREIGRATRGPLSVHLGESPEEVQFLLDGTGPWRDLLERIGAWSSDWVPPACGPVEYVARLGLLNDRLIAVHGVQFSDNELRRLASSGATVVACPRSNRWTGAGVPPIRGFYASGVRVALGTDSLASVADLNLFSEMAEVRRLAPDVPARQILKSATLHGATALGFANDLGSITLGKRAELLAIRVPAGVEDVEEYLVGGIQPGDIEWLDCI